MIKFNFNPKEFFLFSTREKKGIFLFVLAILLVILAPYAYQKFFVKKNAMDFSKYDSLFTQIKNDSLLNEEPEQVKLIDINTATAEDFAELKGIGEVLANRIVKYRDKKYGFSSTDEIKKVYGIDSLLYESISPYLTLSIKSKIVAIDFPLTKGDEGGYEKFEQVTFETKIELNTCDSLELVNVNGIGTTLAKRICAYRKRLKYFYDVSQLKEVFGLKEDTYRQIQSQFFINEDTLKSLQAKYQKNLNTISLNQLKYAPYFDENSAKIFITYRATNGKLKSFDELSNVQGMTKERGERIPHYFVLE